MSDEPITAVVSDGESIAAGNNPIPPQRMQQDGEERGNNPIVPPIVPPTLPSPEPTPGNNPIPPPPVESPPAET